MVGAFIAFKKDSYRLVDYSNYFKPLLCCISHVLRFFRILKSVIVLIHEADDAKFKPERCQAEAEIIFPNSSSGNDLLKNCPAANWGIIIIVTITKSGPAKLKCRDKTCDCHTINRNRNQRKKKIWKIKLSRSSLLGTHFPGCNWDFVPWIQKSGYTHSLNSLELPIQAKDNYDEGGFSA